MPAISLFFLFGELLALCLNLSVVFLVVTDIDFFALIYAVFQNVTATLI